ncbi:MAG: hypothetical protein NVS9B12_13140 [Vulcanimicrobiaceae bacterium]
MKLHLSRIAPSALALVLLSGVVAGAAKPEQHKAPPQHGQAAHHLVTINMDLDFRPHKRSDFGKIQGYDPAEVHVHQNDQIQFVNTDDQNHTATGFSYSGQVVPEHYKFAGDFTKQHGRLIDATEWSTGNVRAHGGKSQIFVAKNVGHYFYGCGYHLGNGHIGVIVVGP